MRGGNIAPKPLEQEVGQMAGLEASKKQLSSRKLGFTVYSKAGDSEKAWFKKTWLSEVKNIRNTKMIES